METNKLAVFVNRLKRIGVNVELFGNYPWIYIDNINGRRVTEKFQADHGFTIAFQNKGIEFTDITEIFKIIRQYANKG